MKIDYLYLGVLPQNPAEKVGTIGGEDREELGFALAVTWDKKHKFGTYSTEQRDELIKAMQEAQCVVGYNCKAFDFKILRFQPESYCDLMWEILKNILELVPLKRALRAFGTKPVLSSVPQMIKRLHLGKRTEVVTALSRHVGAVRRLHEHILQNGWALIESLDGTVKRVDLHLDG